MALIAAAVMGGVAVSASVLAWGGSHSVAYAAETTSEDAVNLLADVFTNQTAGQFAQAPWYCVDTDGNSKEWPSGGTVRSAYAATSGTPEMLLLRWPGSYNNSVTVLEVPGLEANRKYTLTFTAANWNKNEERTVFVSFSTSKVLGASDAQSYSFTCRATSKALDKDRYDDTKEVRTFTFSTIAAGTYYIRFRCERDWADDTIIPISGFSLVDSGDASNAYLERYAEAKAEAEAFLALYPDASAESRQALQTLIDAAIPSTPEEADAAVEAFANTDIRRAIAETNARAAGVEGAVDFSSVIANPDATEGTGNEFPGWNLAQADGGAKMEVYREGKENPTLSDGTQLNYFNPANWGGSDWTTSMEQVVELPAGKYRLSALGRASDGLRWFRLVASTEVPADGAHLENVTETELPSYSFPLKGSTGELFGRGWNMGYCDFELPSDGKVVIAVQANTQKQYQWQSFTGFRLVRYADAEPVEAAPELPDLYVNGEIFTADAISLQMDEVEVTFDLPEDVQLFYKWETSDTGVSAFADAEEDSTDGFTEYTEPVKLSGNGFFHYYAQRGSLRSDIRSLAVSVMSAISAVEAAADASAEYYRLDGVRVDADALTPGIYVRRTAESAVKVVVK